MAVNATQLRNLGSTNGSPRGQWNTCSTRLETSAVPFQTYEDARRDAAAREQPRIDRNSTSRDYGSPWALPEWLERRPAERGNNLALRWSP